MKPEHILSIELLLRQSRFPFLSKTRLKIYFEYPITGMAEGLKIWASRNMVGIIRPLWSR